MCDAVCGVTYLVNRLQESDRVKVLTCTEIISVTGAALCPVVSIPEGIDGFAVGGGYHEQCHYARGVDLAEERLANMAITPRDMVLDQGRLKLCAWGCGMPLSLSKNVLHL